MQLHAYALFLLCHVFRKCGDTIRVFGGWPVHLPVDSIFKTHRFSAVSCPLTGTRTYNARATQVRLDPAGIDYPIEEPFGIAGVDAGVT